MSNAKIFNELGKLETDIHRLESAYQIAIAALQYLGKQGDPYAAQEAERAEKMRGK
jgi:hypothetical protein